MIRMDKSLTVDISLANQSDPKIRREFVERGRAHCEASPCFLPPAAARLSRVLLVPIAGASGALQMLPTHNQIHTCPRPSLHFPSHEAWVLFMLREIRS